MNEIISVAKKAAVQAGAYLKRRFDGALSITAKEGVQNFVTDVDFACEKLIIDEISEHFPDHSILSEESGEKSGSEFLWIVDPLDGTLNYIRSVPLYAVSIAVACEKELVAGVIYLPELDELFWAEKGKGAYLRDKKLKVSGQEKLENALLVTGTPYCCPKNQWLSVEQFSTIVQKGPPIRDLGSCAIDLAYVAAGRFDGFWMPQVAPWDLAAAKILIEEAGGVVTSYEGNPYHAFLSSPIVATNGKIHKELVALLQQG